MSKLGSVCSFSPKYGATRFYMSKQVKCSCLFAIQMRNVFITLSYKSKTDQAITDNCSLRLFTSYKNAILAKFDAGQQYKNRYITVHFQVNNGESGPQFYTSILQIQFSQICFTNRYFCIFYWHGQVQLVCTQISLNHSGNDTQEYQLLWRTIKNKCNEYVKNTESIYCLIQSNLTLGSRICITKGTTGSLSWY